MGGMEVFSTLLILLMFLSIAFGYQTGQVVLPPFWRPMSAFILVAVIGIVLGSSSFANKFYDVGRMRFFLIYFSLFYYLAYFETSSRWQNVLFWTALIVGCYGVVQHFIPIDLVRATKITQYNSVFEGRTITRVFGTFNHPLTFSSVYLFYACLFVGLGLSNIPGRWWWFLNGCLAYLVVLWTESRVAWFAIPVTWLVLGFSKGKRKMLYSLLLGIAVFVSIFALDPSLRSRWKEVSSDVNRSRLWATNWEMFKANPWVGIGFNNNERRCRDYIEQIYPGIPEKRCGHAHSNVLQILSSMGILGTMAFVWLWGEIFAALFTLLSRYPKEQTEYWLALGLFAGFVGFQIQGLTQWNFGDAEVLHNVVFFWAVLASLLHKSSECAPRSI